MISYDYLATYYSIIANAIIKCYIAAFPRTISFYFIP